MSRLVVGSRGSPLALAQTEIIRGRLARAHPGVVVETRIVRTSGDRFLDLSLVAGAGKGLFTKEIEDQLLAGTIDLAVHSMKDLPTALPPGLVIGAVPPREDPRDVLVAQRAGSIDALPPGARVATSSIRRRAQLLARRPDLKIGEIRGNVATRLQKLAEQDDLEALVLAAAGLKRLGLYEVDRRFQWLTLPVEVMLPAVGQGLLAVEVRAADTSLRECLAAVNDPVAAACGAAERAFLEAMGGGCQLPYAGLATVVGDDLLLTGAAFGAAGDESRRTSVRGTMADAVRLGQTAAAKLKG